MLSLLVSGIIEPFVLTSGDHVKTNYYLIHI